MCGLAPIVDTNIADGLVDMVVSWGPNQINDVVDESHISEYKVYYTDTLQTKLGQIIATVSKAPSPSYNTWCCDFSTYSVTLSQVTPPAGATEIMVVPVDVNGMEMPVGMSRSFVDFTTTLTTTTVTTTTTTTTSTFTTTYATLTATEEPSSSLTMTTTTPMMQVVIAGSMGMQISSPCTFVDDPVAKSGVEMALSVVTGVALETITVLLTAPSCSRRLSESGAGGGSRLLTGGNVNAAYTIELDGNDLSAGQAVGDSIASTSTSAMGSLITSEIQSNGGTYDLSVLLIEAPTVMVVTLTTTSTTVSTTTSSTVKTSTSTETSSTTTTLTTTVTLKKAVDAGARRGARQAPLALAALFLAMTAAWSRP